MSHDFRDGGNSESTVFGDWSDDLIDGGRGAAPKPKQGEESPEPKQRMSGLGDTSRDFSQFTAYMGAMQGRRMEGMASHCLFLGKEIDRVQKAGSERIEQLETECGDLMSRMKVLISSEAKLEAAITNCTYLILTYGGAALSNVYNLLDPYIDTTVEAELAELQNRLYRTEVRKSDKTVESSK